MFLKKRRKEGSTTRAERSYIHLSMEFFSDLRLTKVSDLEIGYKFIKCNFCQNVRKTQDFGHVIFPAFFCILYTNSWIGLWNIVEKG